MYKKITIIYNNTPIIFEQLVNTSEIHYNNKIIQPDFIGTKILKCNRNIMDDDIYIDAIVFPCKDLTMTDDIKIIAAWDYIYIGQKPSSPPPVTYDGQVHTNGFDIGSKIGIEKTGEDSGINANSYIATYTPKEGYAWNDDTTTPVILVLTINPRSIDGANIILDNVLTYSGLELTQNIRSISLADLTVDTYTVANNTGVNAGSYVLTCTGTNNFTGTIDKSWTINKLSLAIPYLSNASKIYDGTTQSPSINNFNSTWETLTGSSTAIEAGTYYINWNLKDTANLIWTDNTSIEKVAAWTINKATGTCSGGKNVNPTYNGLSLQIISNCSGTGTIVYSTDLTNWTTTPISQINAGSYVVYYKALESKNYTESAIKSITCTVTPATIDSATLNITSTVFNGTTLSVSVTSAKSGSMNIPSSSYTVSGSVSGYSAGTYKVTVTAKNNFTGSKSVNWTITRLAIDTFTISTSSLPFNGETLSITVAKLSGNGINCSTYTTSGTWSSFNVGTYTATITGTGSFQGSKSATWKITKITIDSLALDTSSKVYNGKELSTSVVSCKANGINATYSTSGTWSATASGIYTATVTGTGNFEGSLSATWLIDYKIIVTGGTRQMDYDQSDVLGTWQTTLYTRLANGTADITNYFLTLTQSGSTYFYDQSGSYICKAGTVFTIYVFHHAFYRDSESGMSEHYSDAEIILDDKMVAYNEDYSFIPTTNVILTGGTVTSAKFLTHFQATLITGAK